MIGNTTTPTPAATDEPLLSERDLSDAYTPEEYDAGQKNAANVAYLHMATAWVDRWKALGGDFGLEYNNGGQPKRLLRGMTMMLETWERTDKPRDDLPPHVKITEERHHDGAVKALEGMLELCPGLREAVREIGLREVYTNWAHGAQPTATTPESEA